jgi:hypothetical protein
MNGGASQFGRVLRAVERDMIERPRVGRENSGKPHPVLGYRSKTDAAVALRRQGLKYSDIAERLGCSENTARVLVHNSGQMPRSAAARPEKGIHISVSQPVAARLFDQAAEAGFEGMRVHDVIRRLLYRIAERRMVEQLLREAGR